MRAISFGLALFFLWSISPRLFATQVIPVNLPRLVSTAGIVFAGRCLDRKVELRTDDQFPHGLVITTYVFSIERCLKGECQGDTITFRQWGGSPEECSAFARPCPAAVTRYQVGGDYVLFLAPTQQLTSPIGLGQGVFTVVTTSTGSKVVHNEFLNATLFSNIPATPSVTKALAVGKVHPGEVKAEIPLDDFVRMVEGLRAP